MTTIESVIKNSGLSKKAFSEKLQIPRRTVENWATGKMSPTNYVVSLIEKRIKKDT